MQSNAYKLNNVEKLYEWKHTKLCAYINIFKLKQKEKQQFIGLSLDFAACGPY